ncbi:MAG: type II toxin-antitoxin system RelE/ParE family toxin [Rhodopila sp.]
MTTYTVVITPEAQAPLLDLYRYIANAASPGIAARYTDRIACYCESFRTAPHRGRKRDDIRPGLRITNYRRRTVIAFKVDGDQVAILGVFHGGRDYETLLQDTPAGDE